MLSNAVICEGKYARASAIYMYREVLPTLRRIVGAEHPYTLVSSMNLALVLDDLGKHGEAETIHREVLAVRRRVLGPEHQDTLTCCANWAVTLSSLGNHIDAEALLREVVAVHNPSLHHVKMSRCQDSTTQLQEQNRTEFLVAATTRLLLLKERAQL